MAAGFRNQSYRVPDNRGMQDRELYRQILGIEAPWFVERVELELAKEEVHVYLEHAEMGSWPVPQSERGISHE